MCQSKAQGGLRCSASARKALNEAIQNGDPAEIRKAKIEYLTSSEGIRSLKEQGKEELAEKFGKRRQSLIERNRKEWRRENNISLALDLDNTTADFTGAFRASLAEKYGLTKEEALARYPEPTDYDMTTWFKGGTKEFLSEFHDAENRGGLYSKMQIFANARKTIKDLHNDGYTIHFVTARKPRFNEETRHALRRYRLPYHLLKHTEEKQNHDAHLFFDDAPKQIKTLTLHGKKVIAYNNPYNVGEAGADRVHSWDEVRNIADKHTSPQEKAANC